MPATDNSAVQITINVVDGATGETISRVTKSLDALGEAGIRNGQKLKQGMQGVGEAGMSGGAAAAAGMKGIGEHALTSLDNVRLLRDDIGIRIPRSMEKAIASSKLLSSAIGAIGGGLLAFGAVEIGVRLGSQLYDLYKKYIDVNGQIDAFKKKLGEAAEQKFFDVASIETINVNLEKTNTLMASLQSKRTNLGAGGLLQMTLPAMFGGQGAGLKEVMAAYNNTKKEEAGLSQQDDDQRRIMEDKHKAALQTIRDNKERAASSGEAAAAQAALNARVAEAKENTSYTRQQEHLENKIKMRGKGIFEPSDPRYIHDTPNSGSVQEERDIRSAQVEYQAGRTKQGIGQRQEADHATAEAGMSGLEGESLHLAQEQEQIRQLTVKAKQTGMAFDVYTDLSQAITTKYNEELKKRQADERAQTAQLDAEAGLGGLTGLAKSDKERLVKLAALNREAPKFSDPTTLASRKADINEQSKSSQHEEEKGFNDRLSELDAGRADRYASESDRITASAKKTVDEIKKAWEHLYGGLGPLDARRVQAEQAVNAEIVKINADAARQRQEAGQRVEDETRKLEDQAARSGLPKYQQETAAIVDDYNERIAKLEELRAKDAANADRYRRQEIAEEQIKNGKLLEQQRALQQQLAGKLTGLFSNPLEALKRQGEEAAANYAAQFLLGNKATGGAATALATGGKGGALPSIFGSGWGGKHPATFDHGASQAGSGTHNDNPLAATTRDLPGATSAAVVTATTATISVGAATFTGSGAGAGGIVRTATGTYAPTGGGGYFNLGGGSDAGISSSSSSAGSLPSLGGADAGSGGSIADKVDAGIGTASSAASSVKDLGSSTGIWNEEGASSATDASLADAGSSGATSGGLKSAGGAGSAISGGLGLFSAIEGKGGFGGALSGALSGAQLGAQFGGPIGAAIGAIGGGILGFIGFGARAKAAKYNNETVKPRLANDLASYEAGQSDYQTVYDGFSTLTIEAKQQTKSFGSGASGFYDDTIAPEIKAAQQRLTREQKAGRSQFGFTAAQFHTGGIIRDFGSMSTTADQGWIHAQRGEVMLNQQAAMTHADAAMLMNSGASRSDMASYYGGGSGTRVALPSSGDANFHFHAPDAKGMYQLFMDNKHNVRAALNSSMEENSGGSDYA